MQRSSNQCSGLCCGLQGRHPQVLRPGNAASFGASGGKYKGVCPESANKQFVTQYQSGRLGFLENRVSTLEAELSDAKSRISLQNNTISNLENKLNSCRTY